MIKEVEVERHFKVDYTTIICDKEEEFNTKDILAFAIKNKITQKGTNRSKLVIKFSGNLGHNKLNAKDFEVLEFDEVELQLVNVTFKDRIVTLDSYPINDDTKSTKFKNFNKISFNNVNLKYSDNIIIENLENIRLKHLIATESINLDNLIVSVNDKIKSILFIQASGAISGNIKEVGLLKVVENSSLSFTENCNINRLTVAGFSTLSNVYATVFELGMFTSTLYSSDIKFEGGDEYFRVINSRFREATINDCSPHVFTLDSKGSEGRHVTYIESLDIICIGCRALKIEDDSVLDTLFEDYSEEVPELGKYYIKAVKSFIKLCKENPMSRYAKKKGDN